MRLSDEQNAFIQEALRGSNILVDACIGSGKTTAIQHLCDAYPTDKRILYLTYNRLLKLDAKSKIKRLGACVTNYHGFASMCLKRAGISCGISDLIQTFIARKPLIPQYDVLVLDEYQDIDLELSQMLFMIKEANPNMQIVAVGDMAQKIYDRTALNVLGFINDFLGEHVDLEFTQCFRLSADHAAKLGRVWNKKIVGVNSNCKISIMTEGAVVEFLAAQEPKDILCLGARTGSLANTLNKLEEKYPSKFNKYNVYASIREEDQGAEPDSSTAIFTTFDASKGLERKICVVFDFEDSYWEARLNKPQQSYEILRNIFCVAASRGKEEIIFVKGKHYMLTERQLSTPSRIQETKTYKVDISAMFDFKFKEDIEDCYKLIRTEIIREKEEPIDVPTTDGLIDLSPCIGIYQEASFFNNYDIDSEIALQARVQDKRYLLNDSNMSLSIEEKILLLTAVTTGQNRYMKQVKLPFIDIEAKEAIHDRLSTVFNKNESVQVGCALFFNRENGRILAVAEGFADVVIDDTVYELKFVSELTHEHFLQCACYMVALGLKKGVLWNVRSNEMFSIRILNRKRFLDAVAYAVTKHELLEYYD